MDTVRQRHKQTSPHHHATTLERDGASLPPRQHSRPPEPRGVRTARTRRVTRTLRPRGHARTRRGGNWEGRTRGGTQHFDATCGMGHSVRVRNFRRSLGWTRYAVLPSIFLIVLSRRHMCLTLTDPTCSLSRLSRASRSAEHGLTHPNDHARLLRSRRTRGCLRLNGSRRRSASDTPQSITGVGKPPPFPRCGSPQLTPLGMHHIMSGDVVPALLHLGAIRDMDPIERPISAPPLDHEAMAALLQAPVREEEERAAGKEEKCRVERQETQVRQHARTRVVSSCQAPSCSVLQCSRSIYSTARRVLRGVFETGVELRGPVVQVLCPCGSFPLVVAQMRAEDITQESPAQDPSWSTFFTA